MQITFLARLASPRDWPATAREIAHRIAFDGRLIRTRQLVYDTQSLFVFLDPGLHGADQILVGRDSVAAPRLGRAGTGGERTTQRYHRENRNPHYRDLRVGQ